MKRENNELISIKISLYHKIFRIYEYLVSSEQYLSDIIKLSIYFVSIIRKCTLNLVEVEYNFRRVFPFWDEKFGLFLPFEMPYV